MVWFTEKDGRRRKGVIVKCKFCKSTFITRKNTPASYCKPECGYQARQVREPYQCSFCNKTFTRSILKKKNSRHGFFFCSRHCKDSAQRIGGISEIMPPHYGTSTKRDATRYRMLFKEMNGIDRLFCVRCGYDEFETSVDIHHVDFNCLNNMKENLMSLCTCCHRALHLREWKIEELGALVYSGKHLVCNQKTAGS